MLDEAPCQEAWGQQFEKFFSVLRNSVMADGDMSEGQTQTARSFTDKRFVPSKSELPEFRGRERCPQGGAQKGRQTDSRAAF